MKKMVAALFGGLVCGLSLFGCAQPIVDDLSSAPLPSSSEASSTVSSEPPSSAQAESTLSSTPPKSSAPAVSSAPSSAVVIPGNENFSLTAEQEKSLDSLIASYGGKVSVSYYDIGSGYLYEYNSKQQYHAASLMKAPFCMYILQKAERGETDLNKTMTYTEAFKASGAGVVQNEPFGTVFTQKELIQYMIRRSDNVAFRMLRSAYPAPGFREYAKTLGIKDVSVIKNMNNSTITLADALIYMKAIYQYINSGSSYGKLLETHMSNTAYPMIRSTYPVARKYGWYTDAFHDMAIIKAPRPYILIILSDHADHGEGETPELAMFRTISKRIEAVSGQPKED